LGKTTKDVQAAWVKIAQADDKMAAFAEVQKEWEAEARGGG
jgi:hypothetical protein